MAWTDLKAAVSAVIKTNGNQEITGSVLQSTLNSIIDQVGANASYKGVAIPSTIPGTPDGPLFYIASTPGTYANFGGVVIEKYSLNILNYSGGSWAIVKIFESTELLGDLGSSETKGITQKKITDELDSRVFTALKGYIDKTTGIYGAGNDYFVSDFISFNSKCFARVLNCMMQHTVVAMIAFYDKNKTFISFLNPSNINLYEEIVLNSTNIPATTAFVRFSKAVSGNPQTNVILSSVPIAEEINRSLLNKLDLKENVDVLRGQRKSRTINLSDVPYLLVPGYVSNTGISGASYGSNIHACLKLDNIKAGTLIQFNADSAFSFFDNITKPGDATTLINGVYSREYIKRVQQGFFVSADCTSIFITIYISPGNDIAQRLGNISSVSFAIYEPKELTSLVFESTANFFNKDICTEKSYINASGGISGTAADIICSPFIAVQPNKLIYVSAVQAFAEYDVNGNFIAGTFVTNGSNSELSRTLNASTKFVRISSWGTTISNDCILYYGEKRTSASNKAKTIVNLWNEEIAALQTNEIFKGTNNLFDKSISTEKSYINASGNVSETVADIICSPFIPVLPNREITVSQLYALAQYDSNKQYIANTYLNLSESNEEASFVTKSNCAFIRISSRGTKINNDCIAYYGYGKADNEITEETIVDKTGSEIEVLSKLRSKSGRNTTDIALFEADQKVIKNEIRENYNSEYCKNSRRSYGAKPAVVANSLAVPVVASTYARINNFFLSKGVANVIDAIDSRFVSMSDIYEDFSNVDILDQNGEKLDYFIWSKGNYKVVPTADFGMINLVTSDGRIVYNLNNKILIRNLNGTTETLEGHGTVRELKYISNNNRLFYETRESGETNKTLRYTDLDGNKLTNTIAAFTSVPSLAIPSGFAHSGNVLIMGRYQEEWDVAIYRSIDNGLTWTRVVDRQDFQHVHGIHFDKYQNCFYAGLDGSANMIMKSIDDGLTWIDMTPFPTVNASFIEMFSGNGFRLFAGEGDIRGHWSIYKTYDDVNFFEVLYAHQDIFALREINGVIVATGLGGKGANRTACIYLSYDDGSTWQEIEVEETVKNLAVGWGNKFISNPVVIDGKKCLILGALNYNSNLPNKLLYIGKDNFQAWFQVKIKSDTTSVVFDNSSMTRSNLNKLFNQYSKGERAIDLSSLKEVPVNMNRIGWYVPAIYMSSKGFRINNQVVNTGIVPASNFSIVFDSIRDYNYQATVTLLTIGNIKLRLYGNRYSEIIVNTTQRGYIGADHSTIHAEKHLLSVDTVNNKIYYGFSNHFLEVLPVDALVLGEIIIGASLHGFNGILGNMQYFEKAFSEQQWYDLFNGADLFD